MLGKHCDVGLPRSYPTTTARRMVFDTMPVRDVLESEAWDGNYFQTAEKEKLARVIKLMQNIRDGKVTISFHLAKVCPGPVAKEISSLSPHRTVFRGRMFSTTIVLMIFISLPRRALQRMGE